MQTTLAALQCELNADRATNVARVVALVREAAAAGAEVILPPELFESPYFPQREHEDAFSLAHPIADHPAIVEFSALARELGVVIPVSVYERANQAYYNTVAIVDADGSVLGTYRKSHIPDGPGYEEKYYFRPGDTGFRVWETAFGRLGVGICWDQWYPEAARAMALAGAEFLLYPTAIGSEPEEPGNDTRKPWRRVMQGHAVANAMPVVAANRIGVEDDITFYGTSFICDGRGEVLSDLDDQSTGYAIASFARDQLAKERAGWGFFRDRRPELYGVLGTADGG